MDKDINSDHRYCRHSNPVHKPHAKSHKRHSTTQCDARSEIGSVVLVILFFCSFHIHRLFFYAMSFRWGGCCSKGSKRSDWRYDKFFEKNTLARRMRERGRLFSKSREGPRILRRTGNMDNLCLKDTVTSSVWYVHRGDGYWKRAEKSLFRKMGEIMFYQKQPLQARVWLKESTLVDSYPETCLLVLTDRKAGRKDKFSLVDMRNG